VKKRDQLFGHDTKGDFMLRKYLAVLLGICIFCVFFDASALAIDLETGFEGIDWGASIYSQPGLKAVGEKDDVTYYQNPNRLHEFEGVTIERVVYGFYKKSFFAAYMEIDELELFAKIRNKFRNTFGNYKTSTSLKTTLTVYRWKHKDVKIKLKYREASGKMKVAFYYIPISEKVNEGDQEGYQEHSIRLVPIEKGKRPKKWIIFEW